jgi:hypothetical protein
MGLLQISMIVLGIPVLFATSYLWYDAKLRKHCIRRLEAWDRE